MNYTIWLVKYDDNKRIVPNGKKWVNITSPREQNELVYAITDHYKAMSGRDVDPHKIGLQKQTTVVDRDIAGSSNGQPRKNDKSKLEYGDELNGGTEALEEY